MHHGVPRVVILGSGFAGLYAAKAIGAGAPVQITLIDRSNHHVFQPLLYEVATAALSPAAHDDECQKVKGLFAWLMWAGIHIMYLIGFRNRLIVMLQWAWTYLVFQRGAWLITGAPKMERRTPRTDEK